MTIYTSDEAVLIGLGGNLPGPFGEPRQTIEAALEALAGRGVTVTAKSRFWRTRPVPASDQPWFVNAVAAVETGLDPTGLLTLLHGIEAEFGRVRQHRNEARIIDLDLLAYGRRRSLKAVPPILPHPRMTERAFVLLPLADLFPDWRHPASGLSLPEMIALLPPGQEAVPDAW